MAREAAQEAREAPVVDVVITWIREVGVAVVVLAVPVFQEPMARLPSKVVAPTIR